MWWKFTVIIIFTMKLFNIVHITSLNSDSVKSVLCFEMDVVECTIFANITLQNGVVLPVNIDCSYGNESDTGQNSTVPYIIYNNNHLFLNRFKTMHAISMNGRCSNSHSFGLEHLTDSNTRTVEKAIFEDFEIENLIGDEFQNISAVKELMFQNNKFEKLTRNVFQYITSVTNISLEQNHIKIIESNAFDNLKHLKYLLLHENDLVINDEAFLVNISCENLSLSIKNINKRALEKLPKTLQSLKITSMDFDENNLILKSTKNLISVEITKNLIATINVIDNTKLKLLNLSHNALYDLTLRNCTNLEVLDLSHNALTHLRNESFAEMAHLNFVYLQNNHLKALSIDIFQRSIFTLLLIDLTNNSLKTINIKSNYTPNPDLKIIVNKNPWNCRWILDLSNKYPEQYRIFQYDKFISRINVNGLECMSYPSFPSLNGKFIATSPTIRWKTSGLNSPGPPDTRRRNHRTDAWLVVLMLFVGVALLTFILYLWIKCQQVFHLSFYRSLPRSHWSPERFDIIREMPYVNPSGYETPLSYDGDNHGNSKNIDISYEEIPEPVKIYEEIQ